MIHRQLWAGLVLTWALAAVAFDLHAATVLNTFAGPGTTATGVSWRLGSDPDPHAGSAGQAVGFYLDTAATIDSVLTTIEGTGTVSLSIVGDMPSSGSGFGLPTGPTYFTAYLTDPNSKQLLDGLNVALPAGRYWLVANEAPSFSGGWQGGGDSVTSPWRFFMSRLGWDDWGPVNPPAVLITSAVPEPTTSLLIVAGLAVVGLCSAKSRSTTPIRMFTASSVPTASWWSHAERRSDSRHDVCVHRPCGPHDARGAVQRHDAGSVFLRGVCQV